MGIIHTAAVVGSLAESVEDSGGAVVVPAFSGLFAPHWRPDARGIIAGLTGYVTKAHLARAALEAVACQTAELVEAMAADTGQPFTQLKADGGMTANALLMQIQRSEEHTSEPQSIMRISYADSCWKKKNNTNTN